MKWVKLTAGRNLRAWLYVNVNAPRAPLERVRAGQVLDNRASRRGFRRYIATVWTPKGRKQERFFGDRLQAQSFVEHEHRNGGLYDSFLDAHEANLLPTSSDLNTLNGDTEG